MSASQPDTPQNETPQNETPPSDFSNYKNIFTYDEINKYLSNIPVINGLNKLYEKTSYLDRYGGSVVIAVFTTIGIFMFFTYSYLKNHSDVIKNNWQKNRCNPLYIPFAGIIIDPKNMTKNEYATENFFHCFGILLKDIVEAALAPIQAATILITATAYSIATSEVSWYVHPSALYQRPITPLQSSISIAIVALRLRLKNTSSPPILFDIHFH